MWMLHGTLQIPSKLTEVYTVVRSIAPIHQWDAPIVSALVLAKRAGDLIKERHTVVITVKLVGSVWGEEREREIGLKLFLKSIWESFVPLKLSTSWTHRWNTHLHSRSACRIARPMICSRRDGTWIRTQSTVVPATFRRYCLCNHRSSRWPFGLESWILDSLEHSVLDLINS